MRVPWKFCEPDVIGERTPPRALGGIMGLPGAIARPCGASTCELVDWARGEAPARGGTYPPGPDARPSVVGSSKPGCAAVAGMGALPPPPGRLECPAALGWACHP